jgi:RNA polymerase sigma factor (sigma-70 family)
MSDSHQWIRDYAEERDEDAFRQIVERYTGLVYSTALRQVGDSHAAQDITQMVFTNLARKAGGLSPKVVLGSWLYRDAVFTASKYRRSLERRRVREEEAAAMSEQNPQHEDVEWRQVAPFVEEAMTRLGTRDRDAIVLRFFEEQPLRAVGAALGISEDAARMRVDRALEKLRQYFARRGVAISAVGLATLLTSEVVNAAPTEITTSIATKALADAGTSSGFQSGLADLFASNLARFASAGVLAVALIVGWIWRAGTKSPPAMASTVSTLPPKQDVPLLVIQANIRRSGPGPSVYGFLRPKVEPGKEIVLNAPRSRGNSDYRLTILPTVEADKIRIASTFIESASDPASKGVQVPTMTIPSGQSATGWLGRYSFEFNARIAAPLQ